MNYEEKYNEILEWARKNKARLNGVPIEEVLPELAESEDERIRKEIYNFFKNFKETGTWKSISDVNTWIAYLEKQKENPKSADSIPSNCTSCAKCEDKWHKVTDSLPDNGRLVLAKDCLGNVLLARYDGENWEVNVYDNEDHYCHNSISKWCEIPSEKQQESLHIPETSKENANSFTDEDERIRKRAIAILKQQRDYWSYDGPINKFPPATPRKDLVDAIDVALAYLEKQKEQKPAEWSEEDEKYLNRVINLWVNDFGEDSDTVKWLKSLKPQSHWKPSEVQLSALLAVFNDPNNIGSQTCQLALTDLYEQLKKL